MDIEEIKKLKNMLELNITIEVSKLVEEFKSKTDVAPSYIGIVMEHSAAFGMTGDCFVGRTEVDIKL